MNTKNNKNNNIFEYSIGKTLRLAREKIGLTQEDIAKRLCLKISIIRDIEEDKQTNNIIPTFLHGYIRSYAKLVNLPNEKSFTMLLTLNDKSELKALLTQNVSRNNFSKKYKHLLILFIYLISLIILITIGAHLFLFNKSSKHKLRTIIHSSSLK